jgi:hypothetical protein
MAEPQAFLLESNWLAVRYALDYDCKVFDEHGVCVSLSGQYSNYSSSGYGGSEWAGILAAAMRLGETVRIGGFIDLRTGPDDMDGISDVSMMPMFGVFFGYEAAPDGTGLQARVSGAYQQGTADFAHASLVGGTADVSQNAGFNTFGFAGELGWGHGFGNGHVLTPFAGLTYAKSSRDSYQDGGSGRGSEPLSFESYAATYATGIFGLRLNGPVTEDVTYRMGVGVEGMITNELDSFDVSGDFGTASYDANLKPSDWALSAALGTSYFFDVNKAVTLDGYLRQVEAGEAPYLAISAGVKIGF